MQSVFRLIFSLFLITEASADTMQTPTREPHALLTKEYAAYRTTLVSKVRYNLHVSLDTRDTFAADLALGFQLAAVKPLTLDFNRGVIDKFTVNGTVIPAGFSGNFLSLPAENLRKGKNAVTIVYHAPYSSTGDGFYRFRDAEDGRIYLYTNFEPYGANRLLPCFDQPDLKGVFRLTVEAPADWQVISAARETRTVKNKNQRTWTFPATPPLSTYNFSLIAGPYAVWTGKAGDIPLRLFCRQTLAQYVDTADWFPATRQGMVFYQKYFRRPYPFKKYDQIVVPDFNSGAMENTAAITFNESYISRGPESRLRKRKRAEVILHEMSHMWFGNLVTMQWWDGLWLNESFASFITALCMDRATEYKDSWQYFFQSMKKWAYGDDQLVTTHPIELPVASTAEAFTNFDGITYGKGAAILKQLWHVLGDTLFQKALAKYFTAHAYGNTGIGDFMATVEAAGKKDFSAWSRAWLTTAGLNTVQAECVGGAGKVRTLTIRQSSADSVLRPHQMQAGLFRRDSVGGLVLDRALDVTLTGPETKVSGAAGRPVPDLIYPNYGDFGYCKVVLDSLTLRTVQENLDAIADPFLRSMLWHTLWEMVSDAVLPLNVYTELVLKFLGREKDLNTADQVLRSIQAQALGYFYFPSGEKAGNAYFQNVLFRMEDTISRQLQEAQPGSEFQKLWLDGYISGAYSEPGIAGLKNLLTGKMTVPGLPVDQDQRWRIIQHLSLLGDTSVPGLITREKKRDPSSRGNIAAISAQALYPDPLGKEKWFRIAGKTDTALSLAEKRAAIGGLFPARQKAMGEPFLDQFFTTIPAFFIGDERTLSTYLRITPPLYTGALDQRITAFMKEHPEAPAVVIKHFKITRQEIERGRRIQELASTMLLKRGK
jgi:aminopeptidase N